MYYTARVEEGSKLCSECDTTSSKFDLSYILNLCQNNRLNVVITAMPIMACNDENHFNLLTLIFCPYSFVLDVLLADTTITLSNTFFLMILRHCTIWHEKVNSTSFHTKE